MSSFREFALRVRESLRDARAFQITFLLVLLVFGVFVRHFAISIPQILLTYGTALAAQWAFCRALKLEGVGFRSPFITGTGLCLFLRAEALWVHPLAAFLAVASKFVVRFRGKHVFNPANFGAVAALFLLPGVWITPRQWGNGVLMAAWFIALGSIVVYRAQRNDMSWTFLLFYLGAVFARIVSHGQTWTAWFYEINGSLLLFTFFMISDPMTIPDHPRARIAYAAIVAAVVYAIQFEFYKWNASIWKPAGMKLTSGTMATMYAGNGMLLALFLCSLLVPVMDRLWPAPAYRWAAAPGGKAD